MLLFELHRRVRRWSLSPRTTRVPLPLTQEHIGDALGLTNVHVNRMLRELREEGVLVLKNGVLRLLDPRRLPSSPAMTNTVSRGHAPSRASDPHEDRQAAALT